eukprot:TRINITY_DN90438_c0_g1_i1.p1 TRINITY_DN90438_c0_g1~~TRINITY_DN90438_c0_g1_i1.p1  ORF type:complete len:320 (-),score=44.18 TRINITY_DN90438_c0_g1_i1:65-1024(-)
MQRTERCVRCGERLGWIAGIRGFGVRARAHDRRCAARHGSDHAASSDPTDPGQLQVCILERQNDSTMELSMPAKATVRQVKKRIARERIPRTAPKRIKLLLFGRALCDDEVLTDLLPSLTCSATLDLVCLPCSVTTIASGETRRQHVTCTLLLAGSRSVGKTSILRRFLDNSFAECSTPTLGVDIRSKMLLVDEEVSVKLNVWDSEGRQRSYSGATADTASLYRRAAAVVLCFDVADSGSFDEVPYFLDTCSQLCCQGTIMCLAGNKVDKNGLRQISEEWESAFAKEARLPYFEMFAQSGHGVEAMFHETIRLLVDRHA